MVGWDVLPREAVRSKFLLEKGWWMEGGVTVKDVRNASGCEGRGH